MGIGLGLLGLEPRAFWSFTLAELDAAVRGRLGIARLDTPPSRREFAGLAERFPDT